MPRWVDQHRGCFIILGVSYSGSTFDRMLHGLLQVINLEVQVHHLLLLALFPGPDGRYVLLDPLKGQNDALGRVNACPLLIGNGLFQTQELSVEIRQRIWIPAVQSDTDNVRDQAHLPAPLLALCGNDGFAVGKVNPASSWRVSSWQNVRFLAHERPTLPHCVHCHTVCKPPPANLISPPHSSHLPLLLSSSSDPPVIASSSSEDSSPVLGCSRPMSCSASLTER